MHGERLAVPGSRGQRGVERAAGIDDEKVAGSEPLRQLVEVRVGERVGVGV